MPRFSQPPVILTFLAPAERCNQSCPQCFLTEVTGEPVHRIDLAPGDYTRFVAQFVEAGIPILSVDFQGYEVTLPRSWPYVDALFSSAAVQGVDRGFVTNGMLLSKWTPQIVDLDLSRIVISLDGASAEVNDPLRGLDGAFDATIRSMRRFLHDAPHYRDRLFVTSHVYHEENFRSLLKMPRVLRDLGLSHWQLGFALEASEGGEVRPVHGTGWLRDRLLLLRGAAEAEGIHSFVGDEFGHFRDVLKPEESLLQAFQVYDPNFLIRMDPLGYVRVGDEIARVWDPAQGRRWNPRSDNAVDVVEYRARAQAFRSRNEASASTVQSAASRT